MTAADVIAGAARYAVVQSDALEFLRQLPTSCVDLVFCSPPYSDCRTYGVAANRDSAAWVTWMRPIVVEACRVSKGLAFFNVSDQVSDCVYGSGPEWLHADLTRIDGLASVRPYIWHKCNPADDDAPNGGQPGSGAKHFHRNCYEPIYGYAEPGKLPPHWSDNTAFGKPPRWGPGGEMSNRKKDGSRVNQWGESVPEHKPSERRKDGTRGNRLKPSHVFDGSVKAVSNPGNVIRSLVGGNHMGHTLAHEGEAPMPVAVAERFVCWFARPKVGILLDPFSGSGTTLQAAHEHNRRFIGCDLRESQVELAKRRIRTVTPSLLTG